jgi:hypothetical protein
MISETVSTRRRTHLKSTELISQLQLNIAGRVDDVVLDLITTTVRDGAVEAPGSGPLGFITVKASPARTTTGRKKSQSSASI